MGELLDWIKLFAICGFIFFFLALFVGPFSPLIAAFIIAIILQSSGGLKRH